MLLADQRTHFGFARERRSKRDALGLLGHGLDKSGVDLFLDQNAAARGTNFTLVDEDAEQGAINGSFPVSFGKENIWGLATEFKSDALERIGGALHDDLSDGRAAGESYLVNARMRNERGAGNLAEAVDDVHDTGRQTHFFKPIGKFECRKRSLLRGFQYAGAPRGDRGRELPCGHQQRIVPRNERGDADGSRSVKLRAFAGL